MTILSGLCGVAKRDFALGIHQPGDTYKLALYTNDANLSPLTETYTSAGEAKGQGYTSGGIALTGYNAKLDKLEVTIGFGRDAIFPNATISAAGALVYNASKDNRAVGVLEFGELVTSTNGNYKVAVFELWKIS